MPSEPSENGGTKSGIQITATGERHIPSSLRSDGTVRKEIKVRPGYRPPEDVEVYKNERAAAWKTRGNQGVPGADWVKKDEQSSTPIKNARKKDNHTVDLTKKSNGDGKAAVAAEGKKVAESEEPLDLEAEKEKEAKKLSKRLRQARDLEQKRSKGDALLPEQFEKVIRIHELIRQLSSLGFDQDGRRKP